MSLLFNTKRNTKLRERKTECTVLPCPVAKSAIFVVDLEAACVCVCVLAMRSSMSLEE